MSDAQSISSKPLSVVLVDDSRVVLTQLEELIGSIDDVEVVGTANDGASAIRVIREVQPDLAILDIVMPGMDGLAALRLINANFSHTRVAMLSSLAGAASKAEEAFRLGAIQVISKPFERSILEALFETEREHRSAEGGGE
ncbi:MAG: response regulator [Myxococcota bacterium]|jgi:YesN/AraC family two-component response regulator|nr:response regulator [Myxococcota bacterium]